MDDFLHNLRSGKLKQADRTKRTYGSQYKNGQKKISNYQPKRPITGNESFERLNAIKDILETLAETQKRMAEAYEARNRTEERKAKAFEILAKSVYNKLNPEPTDIKSLFPPLHNEGGKVEVETATDVAANDNELIETIEENVESLDQSAQMNAEHSGNTKLDDNSRRKLFQLIDKLRSKGTSWVKISDEVAAQGYPTISGRGIWRGGMIKSFYEKMIAER